MIEQIRLTSGGTAIYVSPDDINNLTTVVTKGVEQWKDAPSSITNFLISLLTEYNNGASQTEGRAKF